MPIIVSNIAIPFDHDTEEAFSLAKRKAKLPRSCKAQAYIVKAPSMRESVTVSVVFTRLAFPSRILPRRSGWAMPAAT